MIRVKTLHGDDLYHGDIVITYVRNFVVIQVTRGTYKMAHTIMLDQLISITGE